MNNVLKSALLLAAWALCGTACGNQVDAQEQASGDAQGLAKPQGSVPASDGQPTIVLVHGAFADGTGWQKLIPLLERRGYPVIAVQNALTGISDDVATTKRVIEAAAAKGPVVVVGHSYGGAVMTAAAAGIAQVKALVYVNAMAPEAGEPLGELLHKFGAGPLDTALVPDAAGFLYIDRAQFREVFAADVPATDARVMAATQRPVSSSVFEQAVDAVAWKTIPSWYVLGLEDQAITPDVQHFMAERMGAKVTEVDSSHVTFISHPRVVLKVIEDAVRSTVR